MHTHFIYCGYVPMHIQCIKEIYLMIMNGQLGAMDETYLSKRKTNIVILASIVATVLVKSIFFRITILMLLLTGSKIHPLNHQQRSLKFTIVVRMTLLVKNQNNYRYSNNSTNNRQLNLMIAAYFTQNK